MVTDPIVLEDISAHLAQRVFEAVRDAQMQRRVCFHLRYRATVRKPCCVERNPLRQGRRQMSSGGGLAVSHVGSLGVRPATGRRARRPFTLRPDSGIGNAISLDHLARSPLTPEGSVVARWEVRRPKR